MRRKFKRILQNEVFFHSSYLISVLLWKVYLIYAMPNHTRIFSRLLGSIYISFLAYQISFYHIFFFFEFYCTSFYVNYLFFESDMLTSITLKNGSNFLIYKNVLKLRTKINIIIFYSSKYQKSLHLSLTT